MSAVIEFDGAAAAARPYGRLTGRVRWQGSGPAGVPELRLFWMTSGRGTEESEVMAVQKMRPGQEAFSFELPAGPYSFSGALISLRWALELVDGLGNALALREFTLSPNGRELELKALEEKPGRWRRKGR